MADKSSISAKKELLLIIIIPVLIIGLSSLMYYTGIGAPDSTANKGILVTPPRLASDYGIAVDFGGDLDKPVFTLLQIADADCSAKCADDLYYSRQLIAALGKYRVGLKRRLWLPDTAMFSDELATEHPKLMVSALPGRSAVDTWTDGLSDARYLLVDARGFLFMYYTPEQDYKEIHKDLKFLLKNAGY